LIFAKSGHFQDIFIGSLGLFQRGIIITRNFLLIPLSWHYFFTDSSSRTFSPGILGCAAICFPLDGFLL
jgi:hypothetical protein